MIECPSGLSYSHEHMWAKATPKTKVAEVGISHDLTEELEEVLSIDLPMEGDELDMDTLCIHLHLESGDVRHLRSPLSGRVLEINREVLDSPTLLHLDPYKHWLYKMEYDEPEELDLLMDHTQYSRYLDNL
ncbi:MAG: hypothetical protein A3K19_29070 [Lentisphaerae bacterium RIFOXYB12_FULL_65_16]|nr:MAG: hypothetical protein A3K18_04460 [Lentisphaerae bacterium RIFOXYA12_64_32]OGV88350.1 MAG: hypothetical protein A3K19_29070 [Lentisphaerae bacterium RIFOXYB12_FULL_65_16]